MRCLELRMLVNSLQMQSSRRALSPISGAVQMQSLLMSQSVGLLQDPEHACLLPFGTAVPSCLPCWIVDIGTGSGGLHLTLPLSSTIQWYLKSRNSFCLESGANKEILRSGMYDDKGGIICFIVSHPPIPSPCTHLRCKYSALPFRPKVSTAIVLVCCDGGGTSDTATTQCPGKR